MENSVLVLLISGLVVTGFMVMGGVFNLRRIDMKAMEATDRMTAIGTKAWSYLTPAQQDELKDIPSLLVQEEWVEKNIDVAVLEGVSAERVLIEFANRGFILLGQGVFRRHSSPLDYIEPNVTLTETEMVVENESKSEIEPLQEGALFDEIRKLHPSEALLKDIEALEGTSKDGDSPEVEAMETDDNDVEPEEAKEDERESLQVIIPEGDCRECEAVSSALGKYTSPDAVVAEVEKEPKDTTE